MIEERREVCFTGPRCCTLRAKATACAPIGSASEQTRKGVSDYIQFSAPISPGNSGGPVLDRQGHVVAVVAAKFEGDGVEGLSLAIPVQTVCTTEITCKSG